jgi:hypothetical protein
VCGSLQPNATMCHGDAASAILWLEELERITQPNVA